MKGIAQGVLLVCLVAGLAAGCEKDKKGDISKATIDMGMRDIKLALGDPMYVEMGDGLRAGMEAWYYEKGTVYFYRLNVIKVVPADAEFQRKTIEELKRVEQGKMPRMAPH